MVGEFQARMCLYLYWDQKLASITRFFGAAALTNALLAQLHAGCPLWVSRSALQFLNLAGAELQSVNMRMASRLSETRFHAADLDERIVWHEQSMLETLLQKLHCTDSARMQGIVAELDRLLSTASSPALRGATAPVRMYSGVLRLVVRDLGRRIQFAGWGDRVRIGCGLTAYLRQDIPAQQLARICQLRQSRTSRTWTRRLGGGASLVSDGQLRSKLQR